MVNERQPDAAAAERALALSYAPAAGRAGLAALFALDARLSEVVRKAREPMIAQLRLTWWRDALTLLDEAPAPAEPLLRALATEVVPRGVGGAALAALVETWGPALAEPPDRAAVARERGARLFILAAALLGESDTRVEPVGAAWAAVDLGERDDFMALAGAYRRVWPRALRPLGALGLLARFDTAKRTQPGDPRRVVRLLWHRLTGR